MHPYHRRYSAHLSATAGRLHLTNIFSQGKRNAWMYAKHYTRDIPGMKFLEAETTLVFPHEGRLILAGSDNYGGTPRSLS